MAALELRSNVQLKQTQRLVMTPKLQQALKILQASTLQLEQIIRQELDINPVLDEVSEEDYDEEEEISSEELTENSESEEKNEDAEFEELFEDPFDSQFINHDLVKADEEPYRPEESSEITLYEHLTNQLRMRVDKELDRKIGEFIIGSLDDRGYLVSSVEEIAEQLQVEQSKVEEILRLIQTFDPLGVGARNLQECLLIQLDVRELEYEDDMVKEIVKYHWDDLTHRRYNQIAKAFGLKSAKEVEKKLSILSKLNPKPGFAYAGGRARYITPDLIVEYVDNEYHIYLNDKNIPRLRINSAYRNLFLNNDHLTEKDKKAKEYLTDKIGSAKWLIKAIDQRRKTMIKTMECIVEAQKEFFDKGMAYLRPMNLQEVADKIGVHESTVSRVTSDKYVQTPRGVFELKFFFDSGLGGSNGEDVSATTAKAAIKELIENENPKKPYSDSALADKLAEKGIIIARRTVAKYREQLGILSSRMRKQF